MKKTIGYTSIFTALLIVFALVYPYLHIFEHSFSYNENRPEHSHTVHCDKHIAGTGTDCKICDFHFSSTSEGHFISFEIFSPQQETVYSISLTQTVWDYPDPYFSLRAPPATRI